MPSPKVSFEFFPPGDEAGTQALLACVRRLAPLRPRFASVTYGADGSTRTRTPDCVARIRSELGLEVAPHLTCVGATREEVLAVARDYRRAGIRRMVALRGDPPGFQTNSNRRYQPHPSGFAYASDLVEGLKQDGELEICVAAYPEGHPESGGLNAELANLKRKADAGASCAITQFFFDNDAFLKFRDRCIAAGLDIPLVPGILPITRMPQLLKFAARCGASVPERLRRRFDGLDEDADTRRLIAAHIAIEQVERLRGEGIDEFHFYTLNRAELTYAICVALGLRPRNDDLEELTAPIEIAAQRRAQFDAAARMMRARLA